eukprot:m51a1_g10238 putative somatic embryogenesis receptor kinase (314) ;mRNA; f:18935-20877
MRVAMTIAHPHAPLGQRPSLLLPLLLLLAVSAGAAAAQAGQEVRALCDVYRSTTVGALQQSPWADPCAWPSPCLSPLRGVGCSNDSVVHLHLDDAGLQGTLPPSIGLLANLGSLSVGANYLSGPLPCAIGCLASLEELSVGSIVDGTVPLDCMANLTKLRLLRHPELLGCTRCCALGRPTLDLALIGWGNCTDSSTNGTACAYKCKSGHAPVVGLCVNGAWHPVPSCRPAPCAIGLPGGASGWGSCSRDTPSGSACSFACSVGYLAIEGTCNQGNWETTPLCSSHSATRAVSPLPVYAALAACLLQLLLSRTL